MLKDLLKKHLDKITIFILSFLTIFLLQRIEITFTLSNAQGMDAGQLYYQTVVDKGFNEKKSISSQIDNEELKFEIKNHFIVKNNIRFDIEDAQDLEIEGISVSWNHIEILSLLSDEIKDCVVSTTNMITEDHAFTSAGEDSYIILNIPILTKLMLFSLISLCSTFVLFSAYWSIYRKFFEPIKDDKKEFVKRIQCTVIIVTGSFLLYKSVGFINDMLSIENVTYMVNEGEYTSIVEDEEIVSDFETIGNDTQSLNIQVNGTGMIKYSIEDTDNNIVLNTTEVVFDTEGRNQYIQLDTDKASLAQGENYQLITSFQEISDNTTCIMVGSELSLQQEFKFEHQFLYISLIICACVLFIIFIFVFLKFGLSDKLFLAIFLSFGMLSVIIVPPASREDEYRHFVRAYSLANGEYEIPLTEITGTEIGNTAFETEEGYGYFVSVPEDLSEIRLVDYSSNYNNGSYFAEENTKQCIDKVISILNTETSEETVKVSAVATATRGFTNYWPQVLGIKLGMLLDVRPYFLYYFARIGQLLICALMGYLALKIVKGFETNVWISSFVPSILLLQISNNTDGLLISEVILCVSILLRLKKNPDGLSKKKKIILWIGALILTGLITKTKPNYLLICLGAMLLGEHPLSKKMKENKKIRVAFIICLILLITFVIVKSDFVLSCIYKFVPESHFNYILSHPAEIIPLFVSKWLEQTKELFTEGMSSSFIIPYYWLFILSFLFCENKYTTLEKGISIVMISFTILSIVLVGYCLTPPDYGKIWGITSRYLLPVIPLLTVAFSFGRKESENMVKQIYPILMIGTLVVTSMTQVITSLPI